MQKKLLNVGDNELAFIADGTYIYMEIKAEIMNYSAKCIVCKKEGI
jgi:hypothetical protein